MKWLHKHAEDAHRERMLLYPVGTDTDSQEEHEHDCGLVDSSAETLIED